jgi:hypothetical protein
MKVCPVDSGCVAFETIEEFEEAFRRLADDEELTGETCVEGNSGLQFGLVKDWVDYCGLENVYSRNSFERGFVDEFYFDLRGARHKGKVWLMNADEMSLEDGFLRLWFD